MERQLEIIAYLIARMIAKDDTLAKKILADAIDAVTSTGKERSTKRGPEVDKKVVDKLYSLYPTKCAVSGRATGKSSKDKVTLARLLKDHTEKELEGTITRYIRECVEQKTYIKNFSTFLNNLPDYNTKQVRQQPVYYQTLEELEAARKVNNE